MKILETNKQKKKKKKMVEMKIKEETDIIIDE